MPVTRLLLAACFLTLCSCSPRLYHPDRANVPAFKEAHELKITASVKPQDTDGGSSPLCPAADVAYSPSNHLGIIASWRTMVRRLGYLYPTYDKPSNYSSTNTGLYLSGQRFETGIGYYTRFAHTGTFEVFGGYGNGSLYGDSYFSTRYHRIFVQPEIGFSTPNFSLMCGFRLAAQRYYHFQSPDSVLRYQINEDLQNSNNIVDFTHENFLFVEPFLNMEAGYRFVWFNFQLGSSVQADHNTSIIGDSNIYVSVGLVVNVTPTLLRTRKKYAPPKEPSRYDE